MVMISALKDATDRVRVEVIKNRIIKTIPINNYIVDLEVELLPLLLGSIQEVNERLLKTQKAIKEAIEDDLIDNIFDDEFRRELADSLISNKDKAAIESALNASKQSAYAYSMKEIRNNILTEMNEKVFKITTTEITDRLSESLKEKISLGYKKGWSTEKIAKSLDELKTNASTIARTEINGAVQTGNYRVLEDMNRNTVAIMEKRWATSGLPNTRDSHLDAESQGWIPFDMPYNNGLMHPLDPAGSAGEIINCLCDGQTRVTGVQE